MTTKVTFDRNIWNNNVSQKSDSQNVKIWICEVTEFVKKCICDKHLWKAWVHLGQGNINTTYCLLHPLLFVVVYVNVVIDGKRLCATTLAKFDYMRCEGDAKSGKDGKVWWAESNLCQTLLLMLWFLQIVWLDNKSWMIENTIIHLSNQIFYR